MDIKVGRNVTDPHEVSGVTKSTLFVLRVHQRLRESLLVSRQVRRHNSRIIDSRRNLQGKLVLGTAKPIRMKPGPVGQYSDLNDVGFSKLRSVCGVWLVRSCPDLSLLLYPHSRSLLLYARGLWWSVEINFCC